MKKTDHRRAKKAELFSCTILVLLVLSCFLFFASQSVQVQASPLMVTGLSQPFDVAITPNGEIVYVTNGGSNSVSVINTTSNSITATVPVGVAPFGVAIVPDGEYAYVTNGGSASVSVINTASNTVQATIIVGIGPYGVAVAPDGKYIYVTSFGTNTVSVISAALNMVVATVPVGNSPQGVAISPDGRYVYVANFGAGTVSVINAASNRVVSTLTVECGPNDVAFTPDSCFAYVVNSGSGSVSVIDTATFSVVERITGFSQPSGVTLTPDGAYVYVTNLGGDWVSAICTATNTIEAELPVGRGPYGLAVAPDGGTAYVVNYDGASVSVLNLPSAAVDSSACPVVGSVAQLETTPPAVILTTNDQFLVNSYSNRIAFAVNGTCSSVKLEDNAWVFTDLRLDGSEVLNNLRISAPDSNVTLVSILVTQNSTFQIIQLRYIAENSGVQTLNFNTEVDKLQWQVFSSNVSLPEGKAWSFLPDGTISVTGVQGEVVIQQTAFGDFFGNGEAYSNLPFFEQHTVGITLLSVLAITMVVAVLVKVKTKVSPEQSMHQQMGVPRR